jgi:hypothetical protein
MLIFLGFQEGLMDIKLIFFIFLICSSLRAQIGPNPQQQIESAHSVIENIKEIDFSREFYIKSYPDIDPKWMEDFAIPLSMELGKFFKFDHYPVNFNFTGFYKIPFIFHGGEYVWRAEIKFPLPD